MGEHRSYHSKSSNSLQKDGGLFLKGLKGAYSVLNGFSILLSKKFHRIQLITWRTAANPPVLSHNTIITITVNTCRKNHIMS